MERDPGKRDLEGSLLDSLGNSKGLFASIPQGLHSRNQNLTADYADARGF
jgi:hypothetical protein